MKIQLDDGGNPYIATEGKNGTSVAVKMDAHTRDFYFYAMTPAKGLSMDKVRKSTVFKTDGDLVLYFSFNQNAAFAIVDAVVILRNWEPETKMP